MPLKRIITISWVWNAYLDNL